MSVHIPHLEDTIYLAGNDSMQQAGSSIRNSAELMTQAAANFQGAIFQHERFMSDWLGEFRQVLKEALKRRRRPRSPSLPSAR